MRQSNAHTGELTKETRVLAGLKKEKRFLKVQQRKKVRLVEICRNLRSISCLGWQIREVATA